jgi:prepilin-type N-terminal cleavage/methylation domain-containing protein
MRSERGFTTTELMVVVAILAILTALSLRALKTDNVGQDARKVAALVSTARRVALSGGPVRADVVAAHGIRARAQITFEEEDNQVMVRVWRLREGAGAAFDWVEITAGALSRTTALRGIAAAAEVDPGQTLPSAPSGLISKNFFPDGTCDPMIVYLGTAAGSKWRIVVYPVSGVATFYSGW